MGEFGEWEEGRPDFLSQPLQDAHIRQHSHSLGKSSPPQCMDLCLPKFSGACDLTAVSGGGTWDLTLEVGGELALRQDLCLEQV